MACGTPWAGNEGMNTNTMKQLKSIVFMKRSKENSIEEISFARAYPYILQQTYIPKEANKAEHVLKTISSMYENVSFYLFHCNNFASDCLQVSYNALVK